MKFILKKFLSLCSHNYNKIFNNIVAIKTKCFEILNKVFEEISIIPQREALY